jgi:hypothetical protein
LIFERGNGAFYNLNCETNLNAVLLNTAGVPSCFLSGAGLFWTGFQPFPLKGPALIKFGLRLRWLSSPIIPGGVLTTRFIGTATNLFTLDCLQ